MKNTKLYTGMYLPGPGDGSAKSNFSRLEFFT